MTNEDAIKDIKENIKPYVGGISLDMAIEALAKQIPKKPIYDNYEGHIGKKCICGCQVWRHQKHCENCGQSLLWEDDEND